MELVTLTGGSMVEKYLKLSNQADLCSSPDSAVFSCMSWAGYLVTLSLESSGHCDLLLASTQWYGIMTGGGMERLCVH